MSTATTSTASPDTQDGAVAPLRRNGRPKILYLVHDIHEPAGHRRMAMLTEGGADVVLAGFHRRGQGLRPDGAIDFGETRPARFVARAASVARMVATASRWAHLAADVDAIVCRNLEMLAIGARLRQAAGSRARIVYECLDIHRLMLRSGLVGSVLRALERSLASRADLLITSSPAFVREYFAQRNPIPLPIMLLENKVFCRAGTTAPSPTAIAPCPPWRIGWFGHLRCRRSLDILCEVARRAEGLVEVVLRGRPAETEFDDFHGQVAATPHMSYLGPYRNPEDLAEIYGDVHFAWAVDYFEEGLNSQWLLPNRIYESGLFGAVPIALESVEIGHWLAGHGIGIRLPDVESTSILNMVQSMDRSRYATLQAAVMDSPRDIWRCGTKECRELVDMIAGRPIAKAAA